MPSYMVRVELHRAIGEDYERLHADMEAQGYRRYIVDGVTGRRDHLPTATYDLPASSLTFQQVLDQVTRIADRVRPHSWVIVDEVVNRAWRTAPSPQPNAFAALNTLAPTAALPVGPLNGLLGLGSGSRALDSALAALAPPPAPTRPTNALAELLSSPFFTQPYDPLKGLK